MGSVFVMPSEEVAIFSRSTFEISKPTWYNVEANIAEALEEGDDVVEKPLFSIFGFVNNDVFFALAKKLIFFEGSREALVIFTLGFVAANYVGSYRIVDRDCVGQFAKAWPMRLGVKCIDRAREETEIDLNEKLLTRKFLCESLIIFLFC